MGTFLILLLIQILHSFNRLFNQIIVLIIIIIIYFHISDIKSSDQIINSLKKHNQFLISIKFVQFSNNKKIDFLFNALLMKLSSNFLKIDAQ